MRRMLAVSLFAVCLSMLVPSNSARAQGVQVSGTVTNQDGRALPGLTISLVHPVVGRSLAAITDVYGHFSFGNIPVQQEPYFIEIKWGGTLMYRRTQRIQQNVDLGRIVL